MADGENLDTDILILDGPGEDPEKDGDSEVCPIVTIAADFSPFNRLQENVQPESHHALRVAYNNLKRRFNDLEQKHFQVLKLVKTERGVRMASRNIMSNEKEAGSKGSASRSRSHQVDGAPGSYPDLLHNGEVHSTNEGRENIAEKMRRLEKENARYCIELGKMQDEMTSLKLRIEDQEQCYLNELQKNSQLNDSLLRIGSRDVRAKIEPIESENEDLRKRNVALEKRLKDRELSDRLLEEEQKASLAEKQRYEKLNSELASLLRETQRCLQASPRSDSSASSSEEIQQMALAVIQASQEIVKLKGALEEQQQTIQHLHNRLQTAKVPSVKPNQPNQETTLPNRQAHVSMVSSPSRGGARPKRQVNFTEGFAPAAPCTDNGRDTDIELEAAFSEMNITPLSKTKRHTLPEFENSQIMQPPSQGRTTSKLSRSVSSDHSEHGTHVSLERSPRSPLDVELIRQGGRSRSSSRSGRLKSRWSADDALSEDDKGGIIHEDLSLGSRYDDIAFGNVESGPVVTGTTVGLPRLTRNDSLEHLHDDTPSNLPDDDLDLYGNGGGDGTKDEAEPQNIPMMLRSALGPPDQRSVTPTAANVENCFRAVRSSNPPRPINIERNECDSHGTTVKSYDNTVQNVNLTTTTTIKYKSDSAPSHQITYLNNDPLVGHKTIPIRNIYTEENGDSTAPVVPGLRTVEVSDGPAGVRNCPVCNENFPYTVPMGDFQQHVLDCVGPPSPPQQERACPMCNALFPEMVPQDEFEQHVNNHFADEPLNFEIIRP